MTGLPADVDTTKATISFKMPANKVTLKAQYKKNTYTLTVDGKDEQRDFEENVIVTAQPVEGKTFTGWEVTGLPADVDTTKATISFTMPANNVTLKAQYTENAPKTYKLDVTDAKVTLKDGSDVADLTAVRVGTELVATAPEKDGYTFTGWEVTGLPADVDTTKATISFTMPANKVTLKAQYKKNNYTLTVDGVDEQRDFEENVTVTAQPVEGKTFTGWEVTGLPADVDTTKATISFTMPANNVTLKAQYTENAPKTYKLDVTDAKVTLKDGSDVAVLTAVPVGTELVATAPEKDGYTFTGWKVTGLSADVDTTKATISFTMPANNVTLKAQYTENAPKTYKLEVTDAQVTLKDGGAVADLTAVPVGTELKAIAYEDTETRVFKNWNCTGLELTEEQSTAHEIYFTMPDHDVNLVAEFVTPTKPDPAPENYKLIVSYAKVTLKDGSAVADLKAVPMGTELKATADEDTETSVFKNWNCTGLELTEEQRTARVVYFTMPDHDVELTAVFEVPATPDPKPDPNPTPNPDPTPAPSDDGGGAIVMVAAVGGAAIGVGAYIAGTTAYLKSVLPEGMAIPANRQQLAVALWTAAGKPATQSTALFNDVAADAAELQAIRWVVETGLMSAQDGSFKPGSRVGRMEVIRTWKTYQQRG